MKFDLKLWGRRWRFSSYTAPKNRTAGMYSICGDGRHVVFLDYDNLYEEWIVNEIKFLQRKFNLGNAYIMQSSEHSYHVIFLDKVTAGEANTICAVSNCDEAFKQAVLYDYGARVLRVFPKGKTAQPHFIKVIESGQKVQRKKSFAHAKFIKFNYDIPDNILNLENLNHDSMEKIYLIDYPTGKNV